MAPFTPVRAIQRGFEVLSAISEHGPLTASDVAKRCKIPQPTVVRVIETLIESGYLYRQPGSYLYKVTGRTLQLSRGFDPHARLVDVARPIIERLRADIGWPSNLAVYDRDAMVIAYTNRASLGLSISGRLGARIPILVTGVGLVTLAHMPPEQQQQAIFQLAASGSRWDSDKRRLDGLEKKLAAVKAQGYALADEEYLDAVYQSRIWAVAVPIVLSSGVEAALSSLILRMEGSRKRLIRTLVSKLTAAADEIRIALAE